MSTSQVLKQGFSLGSMNPITVPKLHLSAKVSKLSGSACAYVKSNAKYIGNLHRPCMLAPCIACVGLLHLFREDLQAELQH